MTDRELKKLKDDLWHSADMLREGAHLSNGDYGEPILGLIFLRYADILYKQHKDEIDSEFNRRKGTRSEKTYKEISIEKIGFYLPECAYYEDICNKPDDAKKATLVKKAMKAIEDENEKMSGVLPKDVYAQLVPEEEPELLSNIMRVFLTIPNNINIDLFGEIYEFFLGEFSTGKDGGEYYTPSNVVRYIIEVIQPQPGRKMILDPACGSGGMFVQAAKYMHSHNKENNDIADYRCYGVEKENDTVKIAKMNLLLNNVRGEIREANSFYSDPYDAYGKFDYVMANPPFNVDEVNYEKVKDDKRFKEYGIPRNKTKTGKKDSDKKETVPNANYLWINYFATSLNETGKAGLVMANSASDAGKSELEIRKKLIRSGIIKQMVTLPSNMFTSVTLPATLWFFDREKASTDKKDEILFIDARNIFTQVDRAHRKFSDEQIKNLGIITRLYEGNTKAFEDLKNEYIELKNKAPETTNDKEEKTKQYYEEQIEWLNDKFPSGKYRDVIGLCKIAKIGEIKDENDNIIEIEEDSIADQEYSLNSSRYVGISFDGMQLEKREYIEKNDAYIQEFSNLNNQIQKIRETLISKTNNLINKDISIDGWHLGTVKELGEFKRGKNITSNEMIDGNIPVISAGLGPSGYHRDFNIEGPSITISASGANAGYVSFHMENIWAADCIVTSGNKYVYYLYEILHFIQPIITNLQRGSAQPHVYAKDINRLKIAIPPQNVLNEVNNLLKEYHEQLNAINKKKDITEKQIELILIKLLSDKIEVK